MSFDIPDLCKKVIVTGGAGFIGSSLIRKLLRDSDVQIFNIDKFGYASDLTSIINEIEILGCNSSKRHNFVKIDISKKELLSKTFMDIDPDFVFHLAAESHVDKSIAGPEIFLKSNVLGTFNLLEVSREHFVRLSPERKKVFRFHHVSTDEVFGSLDTKSKFSEKSPYRPNSPYSASKAASDHLVNAWHNTYGLPISITNCSNNYGPWQFPEKLIPLIILKGIAGKKIPLYGDGQNVRDWLFVEDHVEAILTTTIMGDIGKTYCVGGGNQLSNLYVAEAICDLLDQNLDRDFTHRNLISFVKDRPGHDKRYAIDSKLIFKEIGWKSKFSFENGLKETVFWYLNNKLWCNNVLKKSGYRGQRIGNLR